MAEHSLSLIHHLDAVEAEAYKDIFAAAPTDLVASLGLEIHEVAGATLLIAPGIPTPMFNRVIGLGNFHEVSENDLNQIIEYYRLAGISEWWIQLSPGAQPVDLTDMLTARGFTPPSRKSWAKVLRGTEPTPLVATDIDIRPLKEGEELALGQTICAAFEMPEAWAPWFAKIATRHGWRAVAAFDGGTLVGGGLLFVKGNTAWLGAGGVRPEARGHHAHRAMMSLRIELAINAGCKYITTETGEAIGDEPNPSLRNMTACGFSKLYSRYNFAASLSG